MINFWTVKVIRFVVIFFIIACAISSYFYPGGNIHDSSQLGYSFTHNFLSDLGGFESHSGENNFISSVFFNFSMILFFFVGISFLFVPILFRENKITFIFAVIGSLFFFIGSIFFAGVGFTPYDIFFDLHVFFAFYSFMLMIPASFLYLIVFLRSSLSKKYILIIAFFLFFVTAYFTYLNLGESPLLNKDAMITSAIIQKFIAFLSIASIFSLTFGFSRRLRDYNLI
tara:strand:- start:103 stop:783 length:681 start_codon:yes stop_codon:yes gene_type:complete